MSFTKNPLALAVALTLPAASMTCTHVLAAETATLPEVTVSATRDSSTAAAPSTAYDAASLASGRAATSDTASLLRDVPGMSIYTGGGVSGLPVLDGLADDRLRIKVDGMDLISACGNHMNPPLSYIDPSNVGSIKVFAGIVPVSVGGDSIGGAIQVDSATPAFAEPGQGTLIKGEVGAFYRSNGDARGANLSATIASEKVSVTYSGSTAKADNYHAGDDYKGVYTDLDDGHIVDADEVGSTMYKSTNQSIALATRNANHLFELKLGLQDIPYQGWSNQRMDMTGNDSEQYNLRYAGDYDWGKLEARAYHEHTRHYMQFFDDKLYWYGSSTGVPTTDGEACTPTGGNTGCAAGMPMDTEGNNSGLVLKADLPLSARDLLRVGTEAQRYRLDDWWDPSGKGMWPETFWNINNGERDRLAAFGEWEAQWNPQWLTQLGLRYEKVDTDTGTVQGYATSTSIASFAASIGPKYINEAAAFNSADRSMTDHNFDLTALARLTPDDMRTIEFGYARKTRSPNLYERYTWSTNGMSMRMINWVGDGNGYVGNLDLNPEIAHTVSATFDWHDGKQEKWRFKATPYYTYIDDYIGVRRCGPSDVVTGTMSSACSSTNLTATDSFVYLKFINQSASLYGMDVSGNYPLASKTPYGSFTATGSVSYVRGENETTGDNLYNMMPLNAKLAVVQQLGKWTGTAELHLVAAKTDVSAEHNEMETDGYGLLNLRGSYAWKQARLDLGVENVLDRFYNHPLGGTYLGEGKTMNTSIPWGTPVPGMGRSLYAAFTYTF